MQRALKKGRYTVKRRSPSLHILKMVEDLIKKSPAYPTQFQLWRNLPESISQGEFRNALAHLLYDNKIMYDKDKRIVWTHIDDEKREMLKGFTVIH